MLCSAGVVLHRVVSAVVVLTRVIAARAVSARLAASARPAGWRPGRRRSAGPGSRVIRCGRGGGVPLCRAGGITTATGLIALAAPGAPVGICRRGVVVVALPV